MSIWAEGDPLTPTNLNARVGSSSFLNRPEAYGAAANGSTDDYTALVACLTATSRLDLTPGKKYAHSQPIVLGNTSGHMAIRSDTGADFGNSQAAAGGLQPTYPYGPIISICNSAVAFPVGAALASGTGSSFAPTSNQHWLNLRDAKTLDLNGLTAFTAECYVKFAAATDGAILCSCGGFSSADAATHSAFDIFVNANLWQATFTTSNNTATTFGSGTPLANTTYHVALSYDGTTARLFVAGALVGSAAMTGTVAQNVAEDVTVGVQMARTPDRGINRNVAGGTGTLIDSVRISNIARYTAAFTAPTAKFANDANTLMLCNFDLQLANMTRGNTKDGNAWLPLRDNNLEAGPSVYIENVALYNNATIVGGNTGIYVQGNSYNPTIRQLYMENLRQGYMAPFGNVYGGVLERFNLQAPAAGGRYGFLIGANAGISHYDSHFIYGYAVPWVCTAGLVASNIWCGCTNDSELGAIIRAEDNVAVQLNNFVVNAEAGSSANWQGSILIADATDLALTMVAPIIEGSRNQPLVLLDTPTAVTMIGPMFASFGTATAIVARRGTAAPKKPMHVLNPTLRSTTPPAWAANAGDVAVQLDGTQAVTFSGSPSFQPLKYSKFNFTLAGLMSSTYTLQNLSPGQNLEFLIRQDGVGGYTFNWPTNVKGGMSVNTNPNVVSVQKFLADSFSTTPFAYPVSSGATATGPTQFTPASIAGMQFWLQSDKITGLSDGSSIQTWSDLSTAANNFSQGSSTLQPLYKTNIYNGQPSVRYNGTNSLLTFTSTSSFSTPYSLVVVASIITQGSDLSDIVVGLDDTTNFLAHTKGSAQWQINNNGQVVTGTPVSTLNVPKVIVSVVTGQNSLIRVNGSQTTGSLDTWPGKRFSLGGVGSSNRYCNHDQFLVLFYNSQLTAGDITNLEAYANSKYSLY